MINLSTRAGQAQPAVERHWETGDPVGRIGTQYAYDDAGNRILVLHADGTGVRYLHDLTGGVTPPAEPYSETGVTDPPASGDGNSRTVDEVWHLRNVPDTNADGLPDVDEALALVPPDDLDDPNDLNDAELESRTWYDSEGRPIRLWNHEVSVDRAYTAKGELESETTVWDQPDTEPSISKTIAYTYYPSGLRKSMTRPGDDAVTYYYDSMNRLALMVDPDNGGEFRFEYDVYGRREALHYPNGVVTHYTYHATGAVKDMLTVDAQGVPLQLWAYEYDPAGNPIAKRDIDGVVERYGYDSRGRLVRADYPDGDNAGASFTRFDGFRYDPVGNRLDRWMEWGTTDGDVEHVTTETDDANRLDLVTEDPPGTGPDQDVTEFEWMAQGAMAARTVTLAGGAGTEASTFTFDAADRLVSYAVPEGTLDAEYDVSGRRSTVEETESGSTDTDRVSFDGLQEVSFADEDGAWERSQTTTRRLDEVMASSDEAGERAQHSDLVQSTTLEMAPSAGAAGSAVHTGRWRSYGERLQGVRRDTGFVARAEQPGEIAPLRARSLCVTTGTFLSSDPAQFGAGKPQHQHDFSYGINSPQFHVDPTGRAPWLLLALVVVVVAAAVTVAIDIWQGVDVFSEEGLVIFAVVLVAAALLALLLIAAPLLAAGAAASLLYGFLVLGLMLFYLELAAWSVLNAFSVDHESGWELQYVPLLPYVFDAVVWRDERSDVRNVGIVFRGEYMLDRQPVFLWLGDSFRPAAYV